MYTSFLILFFFILLNVKSLEILPKQSNPMLQPLYLYLPGSTFLVSFTDPNKQLPNTKSVSKSFEHCSGAYEIYIYIYIYIFIMLKTIILFYIY